MADKPPSANSTHLSHGTRREPPHGSFARTMLTQSWWPEMSTSRRPSTTGRTSWAGSFAAMAQPSPQPGERRRRRLPEGHHGQPQVRTAGAARRDRHPRGGRGVHGLRPRARLARRCLLPGVRGNVQTTRVPRCHAAGPCAGGGAAHDPGPGRGDPSGRLRHLEIRPGRPGRRGAGVVHHQVPEERPHEGRQAAEERGRHGVGWRFAEGYWELRHAAASMLDMAGYVRGTRPGAPAPAGTAHGGPAAGDVRRPEPAPAGGGCPRRGPEPLAPPTKRGASCSRGFGRYDWSGGSPRRWRTWEAFAAAGMVEWLMYPAELGREPDNLELRLTEWVDERGKAAMFVWRFRETKGEPWLAGVSGPYVLRGRPEPGHGPLTFSRFDKWDAATAEEHLERCAARSRSGRRPTAEPPASETAQREAHASGCVDAVNLFPPHPDRPNMPGPSVGSTRARRRDEDRSHARRRRREGSRPRRPEGPQGRRRRSSASPTPRPTTPSGPSTTSRPASRCPTRRSRNWRPTTRSCSAPSGPTRAATRRSRRG